MSTAPLVVICGYLAMLLGFALLSRRLFRNRRSINVEELNTMKG